MILPRLAYLSLRNRWLTALLTVIAIAVSVALLLGVEKIRTGARASFADTISGTDLIIGARTGGVQLLLYPVFRIGNATNNISWQSYQDNHWQHDEGDRHILVPYHNLQIFPHDGLHCVPVHDISSCSLCKAK